MERKLLEDGSLMVALENYERKKFKNPDLTYYYNETFGDIHVIKFSTMGDLLWMKKVPKLQTHNVGDYLASASIFFTEKGTLIFMSDNDKNNKDLGEDAPAKYDRNSKDITLIRIDNQGEVERNALFTEDSDFDMFPRCRWIIEDNKRFIMPAIERKALQMIAFELE